MTLNRASGSSIMGRSNKLVASVFALVAAGLLVDLTALLDFREDVTRIFFPATISETLHSLI